METTAIIKTIISDICNSPSGAEFTTATLCEKLFGKEFLEKDSSELMDIHYQLIDELEKQNLEIEYTDDGIIGLPYNISFIVKVKN